MSRNQVTITFASGTTIPHTIRNRIISKTGRTTLKFASQANSVDIAGLPNLPDATQEQNNQGNSWKRQSVRKLPRLHIYNFRDKGCKWCTFIFHRAHCLLPPEAVSGNIFTSVGAISDIKTSFLCRGRTRPRVLDSWRIVVSKQENIYSWTDQTKDSWRLKDSGKLTREYLFMADQTKGSRRLRDSGKLTREYLFMDRPDQGFSKVEG